MIKQFFLCFVFLFFLSACHIMDDLESVGKPPKFTPVQDPFKSRPVSYAYAPEENKQFHPQSLWAEGKQSFFVDLRAHRLGDIVKVLVDINNEKATLDTTTTRSRKNESELNIPNFFNLSAPGVLGVATPTFKLKEDPNTFEGKGKVDRKESINVAVSAVITEVLPNGNFVIEGRQEARFNFEIREIYITGIIRPTDISPENTVEWNRVAEARIGYGGRGQITQFQQPAYGQQVLDILTPF